jgi:YspA, cpYpsA-related SLOG family
MKHVAIVGSRSRTDPQTVDRLVAGLPAGTVIVSGGAPGPDTWAEEAARKYGLPVQVFRPDLEGARTQGQKTRRYHNRNQRIVDAADEVVALVGPNRTGGTEDTILRAERKGIPVTLLYPFASL